MINVCVFNLKLKYLRWNLEVWKGANIANYCIIYISPSLFLCVSIADVLSVVAAHRVIGILVYLNVTVTYIKWLRWVQYLNSIRSENGSYD